MKKRLFPNSLVMGLATIIGTFALSSSVEAQFDPARHCVFFDKIVFDICKKSCDSCKPRCDGPYDYKVQDFFGEVSKNLRSVARDAACRNGSGFCDVKIRSVEFAADCQESQF